MKKKEIIGRKAEQLILNNVFNSKKAEFVAVYGRRRVGKTYLIDNFFANKACQYFSITGLRDGTLKQQLSIFSEKMSETFFAGTGIQVEAPKNWMQAFNLLTNTINQFVKQKKIVLFFDELPWLASKKSGFKNALDHYWNTKWSKDDRIILVVCGSAASWIIKHIINDKGGLHNRVTLQLPLYPFSLNETNAYLKYIGIKFNSHQVLELYMALGGIPHYLANVNASLSAAQNISALCFVRNGQLFDEFHKLFSSLFDNATAYIELIKIVATKRNGITRKELETKAKLSGTGGTLTERINALEQAGFIKGFVPIGYTEKGLCYRLIDEYCLFYLTWIHPVRKQLETEVEPNYWVSKVNSPAWRSWSGYAFEAVCLKHITHIKKALFIPPGALSGAWYYQARDKSAEQGAQIDLLFDRDDGVVTLCEIKYCKTSFEIDKKYAVELQRKMSVFKERTKINKQLFLSMITAEALKKNRYSTELITSTATLDDLLM